MFSSLNRYDQQGQVCVSGLFVCQVYFFVCQVFCVSGLFVCLLLISFRSFVDHSKSGLQGTWKRKSGPI